MKLTDEQIKDMTEDGEPPACHSCGYPASVLGEYRGPITNGDLTGAGSKSIFCEICATTFLSHHITFPLLYGEQHHLFSSIGWIANHLQDEIRKLKT